MRENLFGSDDRRDCRAFARFFAFFCERGFTASERLRIVRAIDNVHVEDAAQVVKLVDTPASGAGDRKVVEVRVFSWAPIQDFRKSEVLQKPAKAGFCVSGLPKNTLPSSSSPRLERIENTPATLAANFDLLKAKQGFTDQNSPRIVRHINSGNAEDIAQMVKLVDTPASGAGGRKAVEVRVFFWAPYSRLQNF